jgi:NAD(P)-dependent dehydrogenase (short-subunit alcohol dehydrogenase family)
MIAIDLTDDVVLVMGGGGSIGSAIARTAARAGARVAVADSKLAAAQRVADEIVAEGGSALALQVDLTDADSVQQCVDHAVGEWGSLNSLVNAAGFWSSDVSERMTDDMWNAMMEVNLTGVFRACRAAVPALKTAGSGAIVSLASVAAFAASGESAPYSATKAGVIGYTAGLSGELAPHGIRVNAISPGWVDGGFTHQALATATDPEALRATANGQHLLGRMATPDDVANAAVWLLSDLASFVTGTELLVDGGYTVKH